MRIYIVGFMGSGKTTVGKLLAQKLGFLFADSDEKIELEEQMKISEIFQSKGEDHFRLLEHQMIKKLNDKDLVVSTGGGLPCYFNNMEFMSSNGVVIYLDANPFIIAERLQIANDRPLLHGNDSAQIIEFVTEMLNRRKQYYEMAHFKVNAEDSPENVVKNIISKLKDLPGFKFGTPH